MNQLSLESISLARNAKLICHNFSLAFQEGVYTLLGPNGSGKTSLLHTIAQWLPLQSGEIKLNGTSLVTFSPKARAQLIGILPQNSQINFPCSVFDFVLTGRYPYQSYFKKASIHDYSMVKEILSLLELSIFSHRCITTLSGGELQRVKIACILIQDPAVYLLDEPCNHLDIKHQYILLKHLKYLSKEQKKIVILSSHDYHMMQAFSEKSLLLFETGPVLYEKPISRQVLANLYQLPESYKDYLIFSGGS